MSYRTTLNRIVLCRSRLDDPNTPPCMWLLIAATLAVSKRNAKLRWLSGGRLEASMPFPERTGGAYE